MDTCPHCHRKLLAHSSPRCNWCGAVIDDPAYQQEATKESAAFFAEDRLKQAAEIADVEAISPILSPVIQYAESATFLQPVEFREPNPEASPSERLIAIDKRESAAPTEATTENPAEA
jgi:hypothetical protein